MYNFIKPYYIWQYSRWTIKQQKCEIIEIGPTPTDETQVCDWSAYEFDAVDVYCSARSSLFARLYYAYCECLYIQLRR